MPHPQNVIVTYSGPLAFLQSDHWNQVHAALAAQLPLRTLHWRSAARSSLKTIQVLDVDLVPLDEVKYESTSQVPQSVLARPLLNIYVFVCEDADAYKNSIRKQIKEWHSLISERRNQEYMIVHVARPDARVASGGIFNRSATSVLDKVRADFNTEKRERCVSLAWSQETAHPAVWADLVNKIKENILNAFDMAISAREEEVRRSESQRTMPGWNFCTFFVLKESLASSFDGVKLHDEALAQYDSLESSFFGVLQEKSLSWFGNLIPDAASLASEISLPLLSTDKRPYRDLIMANTISVFDFRVYLLAQQCNLLGKMTRVVQVAKKVTTFLGAFGRRLREVSDKLPPRFIESWSYTSALSVVEQCDVWAAEAQLEESAVMGFNAAKAELLEYARKQLDIIGIRLGHLPARLPFSASNMEEDKPSQGGESELLKPLQDASAFYERYIALTNRAIDLYVKSGRKKFALRLHGDLAAVDMQRGRVQQAVQTYSSLPTHYAHYHWALLESFLHRMGLDLRSDPDAQKNKEWVQTAFALLKLRVEVGEGVPAANDAHSQTLVQGIVDAASQLSDDLLLAEYPAFKFTIKEAQTSVSEDDDGSYLLVHVKNALSCSITVSEIIVSLSGRNTEQLSFTGKEVILRSGITSVKLHCPNPSSGTFIMTSGTLRISKVVLTYAYQTAGSTKPKLYSDAPILVHIPKDSRAVDVQLHQPRRIQLGASASIVLTLSTGRNDLQKATIKLKGPGNITFMHSRASAEDSDFALEADDEAITFLNLGKERSVSICVPHTNASSFQSIEVNICVDYSVVSHPDVTRSLVLTREVVTSLPLQVNVQDFFRGQMLFSRFTISTTSQLYIRVDYAELIVDSSGADSDALGGVEVSATGIHPEGGIVVTPAHPTNFLFKITSEHGPVRDNLQLRVKYRTLHEETAHLIRRACAQFIEEDPSNGAAIEDAASKLMVRLDTQAGWSERYRMTGQLELLPASETDDTAREMLRRVNMCEDAPWRELLLPLDIPQMNILSAVRVRLIPPKTSSKQPYMYAGQPISAELTIQTSFHWGPGRNREGQSHRLRFDVEEMVREWLVSGRKRGDFAATDGGTYTLPLTLIALNHGELALPKVVVTPFPLAGEMTMGSMALPSSETHQLHGAEKVLILPRGGRTTFVVGMRDHYH